MASVMVPLVKLIDLALGTPEVGAVNFNILHTALLVIVDKINLSNINIEFKGSDATKIETLKTVAGTEKTQKVLDYNVTTADTNTKTEEVVSVRKNKPNKKLSSQSSFVETSLLVLATKVDALQAQVNAMDPSKMPHSEQLIQSVRNKLDDSTPIVDTVQQINLAKRLSAAEIALEQLASMMESLTEEYNNVKSVLAEQSSPSRLEMAVAKEESEQIHTGGDTMPLTEFTQLKLTVQELSERIQMMSGPTETVPFQEMMKSINEIEDIKSKVNEMKKILQTLTETEGANKDDKKQNIVIKMNDIETTLKAHQNQLDSINGIISENIDGLQKQFFNMEKEINLLHEKIQVGDIASVETAKTMQSESQRSDISTLKSASMGTVVSVLSRLNSLEDELTRLATITESILEEEEKKKYEFKTLSDQIEILKTGKVNKLDVEDIMAAKADKSHVHRKVSYDHFDHVLEDLKKDFNNVITKLDEHEKTWQQDLERLGAEFKEKLDQEELGPLKEFVADKLKLLQEKIKALALMRKEAEAAGAKRKFLKEIYCISCDKDVVMNAEMALEQNPLAYPVQPVKSIRPYLTYKLDQVRKQQSKLPYGRNLVHFEEVLKAADTATKTCATPVAYQLNEAQHLSNRYCGGSHTITTPQQRVTRTGHHFV